MLMELQDCGNTCVSPAAARWNLSQGSDSPGASVTWQREYRRFACTYAAWGNWLFIQADRYCSDLDTSELAKGRTRTTVYDCDLSCACLCPKPCRRMTWVARGRVGPAEGVSMTTPALSPSSILAPASNFPSTHILPLLVRAFFRYHFCAILEWWCLGCLKGTR